MLIYDGPYRWDGWGARFKLGSGECRLRIYDLSKSDRGESVSFLKPLLAILTDTQEENPSVNKMTVRGCAGHIATCVVKDFNLDAKKIQWVEYYPPSSPKAKDNPEKLFHLVEFQWRGEKALRPDWRTPPAPLLNLLVELIRPGRTISSP